jgi:hypothetical protein
VDSPLYDGSARAWLAAVRRDGGLLPVNVIWWFAFRILVPWSDAGLHNRGPVHYMCALHFVGGYFGSIVLDVALHGCVGFGT